MRDGGLGIRAVGWGLLIAVVVAAAAVGIGYQFGLVGDQRTYIDVHSGDLAVDRTLLGIVFSHKVTSTDFAAMERKMGLGGSPPDWRQIRQFSWLAGTRTDFPMAGADSACAGAIWKVQNEKTDADKRNLLASYAKLLQAGDEKGMEKLSASVGEAQNQRAAGQVLH